MNLFVCSNVVTVMENCNATNSALIFGERDLRTSCPSGRFRCGGKFRIEMPNLLFGKKHDFKSALQERFESWLSFRKYTWTEINDRKSTGISACNPGWITGVHWFGNFYIILFYDYCLFFFFCEIFEFNLELRESNSYFLSHAPSCLLSKQSHWLILSLQPYAQNLPDPNLIYSVRTHKVLTDRPSPLTGPTSLSLKAFTSQSPLTPFPATLFSHATINQAWEWNLAEFPLSSTLSLGDKQRRPSMICTHARYL